MIKSNIDDERTSAIQYKKRCLSVVEMPVPNPNFLFISNKKTMIFNKDFGIPLIVNPKSSFELISAKTLKFLLQNKKYPIELIDCSFSNCSNCEKIVNSKSLTSYRDAIDLFKLDFERIPILIFYSNYSECQSCNWATLIRHYDRCINIYPKLKFPHIYLLQGGYKEYYNTNYPTKKFIPLKANEKEAKAKSDFQISCMINFIKDLKWS